MFYGIPWSHGTLGFLVAAELKIIPAKKFVKLQYEPIHKKDEIAQRFHEHAKNPLENDFLECLVFSETEAVVMTGQMVDEAEKSKVSGQFSLLTRSQSEALHLTHNYELTNSLPLDRIKRKNFMTVFCKHNQAFRSPNII